MTDFYQCGIQILPTILIMVIIVQYSDGDLNSRQKVGYSGHWLATFDLNTELCRNSDHGLSNRPFNEKTPVSDLNTRLVPYSDPQRRKRTAFKV